MKFFGTLRVLHFTFNSSFIEGLLQARIVIIVLNTLLANPCNNPIAEIVLFAHYKGKLRQIKQHSQSHVVNGTIDIGSLANLQQSLCVVCSTLKPMPCEWFCRSMFKEKVSWRWLSR